MKCLYICPTYGRIPYLGRMLAGFLNQDYDDVHLVIINDDNNIKLNCNYDNVTCLNLNKRVKLDVKRNLGACFGDYDIIFPYDDDDFIYPERTSIHVEIHKNNPNIGLYRNFKNLILINKKLRTTGALYSAISFKKKDYFEVGGYTYFKQNSTGNRIFSDKMASRTLMLDDGSLNYIHIIDGVDNQLHRFRNKEHLLEEIAHDQLKRLNLLGKEFVIEPDLDQWNTLMRLRNNILDPTKPNLIPVNICQDGRISE